MNYITSLPRDCHTSFPPYEVQKQHIPSLQPPPQNPQPSLCKWYHRPLGCSCPTPGVPSASPLPLSPSCSTQVHPSREASQPSCCLYSSSPYHTPGDTQQPPDPCRSLLVATPFPPLSFALSPLSTERPVGFFKKENERMAYSPA